LIYVFTWEKGCTSKDDSNRQYQNTLILKSILSDVVVGVCEVLDNISGER